MSPFRLLLDPPGPGTWNMAVDEFLLHRAGEREAPAVRIYSWSEPTLSLGYFQPYADRELHPPSLKCPVVRRRSGGGAILHDREITYCVVAAPRCLGIRRPEELYVRIHSAWMTALARQTLLPATLYGQCDRHCDRVGSSRGSAQERQPFLCFQRRCPWDVVVREVKIIGSAQRRHRGAILQHGSVLCGSSPVAPELPGINDLLPQPIDTEDLIQDWLRILAAAIGIEFIERPLEASEQASVDYRQRSLFAETGHLLRR